MKRRNAVYAEWKRRGEANPIAFPQFTASLLQKFQASGALLARKFPANSVHFACWNSLVLEKTNGIEKRSIAETTNNNDRDNPTTNNNHDNQSDDENHLKRLRTE